jgi:hypothetical protein
MAQVSYVKMINGDELLTQIPNPNQGPGWTKFFRTIQMHLVPPTAKDAPPGIAFAPWPAFAGSEEVQVNPDHIMTKMDPPKKLLEEYNRIFSPVIQAQTPKLILPGA